MEIAYRRIPFARGLLRFGVGVVGVSSCAALGYYALQHRLTPQQLPPTSTIVGPSASVLTGAIVDSILKDPAVVDNAVSLIARSFLHPLATQALKEHFVGEFTDNDATVRALKTFVLSDVIQDPWVSEELISLARHLGKELVSDPSIWPGQSLELLRSAALEGLEQDRFRNAALSLAKSVVV